MNANSTTSDVRQLITRERNGIPAVSHPNADKDLSPMIAEIKEVLAKATESVTEQLGHAVKVVERRGGEGAFTKVLVIRRDEIVLQWDFKFATD